MANDSETRALARRLARLERQVLIRKQPGLAHSSIEDGAIQSVDTDGNLQMIVGTQFDGTQTSAVISGPVPPQPLQPGVTPSAAALRIYWDGTFIDNAVAPMDFARVLAYVQPLSEYVGPDPLNQALIVGQFTSATGGEISAVLEPNTEYAVHLVAWTQAGKFSAPSDVAVVTTLGALQGEPGEQGVPGPPGADGQSLYTWVKYADTPTTGMSDNPTGKTYIGLAYNKEVQLESTDYADYSWSLIKGADGADGLDGADGVTISSTSVTYQKSSSGTIAPTGSWTTSVPVTVAGEFLWSRTVINFSDGTSTTTYAVAAHGSNGAPGDPGADGLDGVGISSTEVRYQVGSSGTTAPTGTWLTTVPATTAGQFLWTRTVTTLTDGSSTTSYSVAAHGATGSQGIQGPPGPSGQTLYTWVKYADTPTTGMSDDPTGKTYIGLAYNKTSATESSTYTDYAWSLIKGADGQDGADGNPGPPGTDGQTTYTWVKYGTSAAGAGLSDDPTGKTYIGLAYNKTTPTESTDPGQYQWALIKGADGQDGATGPAGRGISSTAVTYAKNTSGTTAPASGSFTSAIPATSPGEFLWTRTVTTYTDTSTTTSYSVAAHGATGSTGATGPAGRGISSTAVTYQASASGTTAPTGTWTTGIPATNPGDYLWTRVITTYTDTSTSTSYSVARHGQTGSQGIQGPPGPNGQSLYTWVKYADTSTGGGMSDDPTGKFFIGFAYNKTSATESTVPSDYQWSRYRGVDAPTTAPGALAVKITGTTASLIVETGPVEPGTTIEYHISTTENFTASASTLYVTTAATIAVIPSLATGEPLVPNETYYIRVRPINAVGAGSYSPAMETALDMSNLDEFVVSTIKTGFVLTGRVQVGQILIDANDGITIPQPNGGVIVLPANGDPASISSHLDAFSLTVRDRLAIRGLLNEISTGSEVSLSSGVTTPTSPPAVAAAWLQTQMNFAPGFELGLSGLAQYGGDWYSTSFVYGSDQASIKVCNNSGAGLTSWNLPLGFIPVGGCAVDGTTLLVLGYDKNRPDNTNSQPYRWFVRRYQITNNMAFLGEWEYTGTSGSPYNPGIGISQNTNEVVIGRTQSNGRVRLTRFVASTGATVTDTVSNNSLDANVTSAHWGTWDMGSPRFIYTSTSAIAACDANGVNTIAWDRAAGAEIYGMTYSTANSRWYHLDSRSKRWQYSSHFSSYGTVRSVDYSWFDSDAGGTGQHETNRGPVTNFLQPRRAFFSVTTPPPNDTGGADDPNAVRIWVNGQRQPDLGTGVTTAIYDQPSTGTTTKAAAFATSSSSARLRSGAADVGGPLVDFRGSGASRVNGMTGSGDSTDYNKGTIKKPVVMEGMQAGTGVATITSTNLTTNTTVTFPRAFPAGSTVVVVVGLRNLGHDSTAARVAVTNESTTGFTVQANRSSGTANLDFSWIAYALP